MLMRRVEREYYDKELLMHKNNLRKSWEILKDVINKKKKIDLPDKFNIDDDMVTDKLEIALNFNNFYVNIGKKLSSDIPTNSGDPLSYIKSAVPDSIFLESVDESEIINICKNMKDCSSGWDQILPKVVKSTYQNMWSAVAQLVERRTRNRESPGSNPRCYRFEVWACSMFRCSI